LPFEWYQYIGSGDDPFPLKFWLKVTYPLLKAASFDTFCLVAPEPYEIEQGQQSLTGQRATNFRLLANQ